MRDSFRGIGPGGGVFGSKLIDPSSTSVAESSAWASPASEGIWCNARRRNFTASLPACSVPIANRDESGGDARVSIHRR
jgi:hypothetical protein